MPVRKILIAFFFICAVLPGQNIRNYTVSNSDLPGNQVRSIVIDANNVKWIATNSGLASFYEETSWVLFTDNTSLLPDNSVNDLAIADSAGSTFLWIASAEGLSKAKIIDTLYLDFLKTYDKSSTPELTANTVSSIGIDQNSTGWFGTDSGVSSFDGQNWASYTVENFWIYNNTITDIQIAPDTMVYFATEGNGISRLKLDPVDGISGASFIDTQWAGLDDTAGTLLSDSVYTLFIEENGWQWYGTKKGISLHSSNLTRLDWTIYNTQDGLVNDSVTVIFKDSRGSMWFGTEHGLSQFSGSNWKNYTILDGLAGNKITSISEDKNGSIWIGTEAGLSQLDYISSIAINKTPILPVVYDIINYPNPFNGETLIQFYNAQNIELDITVFNILGQKVKNLVHSAYQRGAHTIKWDGRDAHNNVVPSGSYIISFKDNFELKAHLIMFLK